MFEIRKQDALRCRALVPQSPQDDVTYVPSQFALSFDHRGRHLASCTLTGQCVEAKLPQRCRAGEGYDELIEAHFLVPLGTNEAAEYVALSSAATQEARRAGFRGYAIFTTMRCNARCSYCDMWGNDQLAPMTLGTAEQVVRYILDTRHDGSIQLCWFGGEPLMNTQVIDHICTRLANEGVPFTGIMDSNGTLITPQVVDRMHTAWHINRVQVCMDGSEGEYVYRKHYYTSRDYYHLALDAIDLLSKNGIAVSVRCNVDCDNLDEIPDFLDDLKAAITHKENVEIYFAPLDSARMGERGLEVWRKAIDALKLVSKAGFGAASPVGLSMSSRAVRGAVAGDDIAIGCDGSLYPHEYCSHNGQFGNVFTGQMDDEKRRSYCHLDSRQNKCLSCALLPLCDAYATCPEPDGNCQEVRRMLVISELRALADKAWSRE